MGVEVFVAVAFGLMMTLDGCVVAVKVRPGPIAETLVFLVMFMR